MTLPRWSGRLRAAPVVCLIVSLLLVACSSDGGGGDGAPSSSPVTSSDPAVTGEAPTGGPGAAQSPGAFAEYYRKLGVAEPVVNCYVGALTELGVTSLDQLESDQELGVAAAARFDQCVADAGGGASTGTTA